MRIKIILILSLISSFAYSQIAPKYSNEFLSLGVGARGLAMGSSVIASSFGTNSAYWNPAGILNNSKNIEISGMHSEYFAGISKFDFLSGAYQIDDKSAIGVSMIRFAVDDIPNTLDFIDNEGNFRYDRISSFSVADLAFLFSYARKSNIEGLSYGANFKIIKRNVGEFANALGFGLDAGAQYQHKNWQFGAMFKDITSTFNAWNYNYEAFEQQYIATGNEIPENSLEITLPKLLIGAGYNFILYEKFNIYPELGLDFTFDGKRNTLVSTNFTSIEPHAGLELSYNKLVYLRAGFKNFQKIPDFDDTEYISWQPNFGIGINFKGFRLDYAFTDIGAKSFEYSHIFSLAYSFNYKAKSSNSKI